MRLLLVEDSPKLSDWLAKTLVQARYQVDCCYDGAAAEPMLKASGYDAVILDIGLPRMDGREVLRRMRARGDHTPVLLLTAKSSVSDRVDGLNLGADDFLSKPFEMAELDARIRALVRRSMHKPVPLLECGDLQFDSHGRSFQVHGEFLALPPREHALLEALMLRSGKAVPKRVLIAALSSYDEETSPEAIEVYVHRLRKKLAGRGVEIATLRGIGYALKAAAGVAA